MTEKKNFVYIVRCADGTYYTGWTTDIDKRLKAHNEGRGAKYTRSRRPVTLVRLEAFTTKGEALSRERAIKKLTRAQKEALIKEK
ncbi:MAG: GIY-YIG nuclease family protein [Anaerovoracaceae bacterium]|jgi:putative endonuclease